MGASRPPNIPRKLVKSQPCCKRVGHSKFCDFFYIISNNGGLIGQNAPPPTEGVSVHNWIYIILFKF